MSARYPWAAYREPWQLTLSQVLLDDAQVGADVIDESLRRIRLDEVPMWESLTLSVHAWSTETEPDGLDDTKVCVLVETARTQMRRPTVLQPSDDGFAGKLRLERAELAGRATVRVQVASTVVGTDRRTRLVADAETWDLIIDASEAPRPPGAPPFPPSWIHFSDSESPMIARQFKRGAAVLDLSGPPVLLLNKDVDGLQELVHAQRPQLERKRQQDVIATGIARDAVAALFRAAVAEVDLDDEEAPIELPPDRMHREVCQAVAGAMPSIADATELLGRLRTATGAADRAALWAEIDLAISGLTGLSDAIFRVSGELKHG